MDERFKAVYDELYGIIAARSGEYALCVEDQCAVWEGRSPGEQPLLFSGTLPENGRTGPWPAISTREIHFDKDKMLVSGMIGMASSALGEVKTAWKKACTGCQLNCIRTEGSRSPDNREFLHEGRQDA